MSRIRANKITNQAADGAPTVENGLIIAGVTTVTGSINNLNLTGITTVTTLDLNGDLDVDGHLNADNVSIAGVVTATTFSGSGASLTNLNATNLSSGTVPLARLGDSGTKSATTFLAGDNTFKAVNVAINSIASDGANRVLTSDGDATATAESNLSFDGATLTVNGTTTDTPLILTSTNVSGSHLRFQKDGSNKHFIGSGGGFGLGDVDDLSLRTVDNIIFGVGTSEKVRITSSGNVGINDTDPSYALNVIGDNTASNGIGMLKGIIGVQNDTTAFGSSPTAGISFQTKYRTGPDVPLDVASIWGGKENTTNGDKDGYMGFAVREEPGSGTQERMRITSEGHVLFGGLTTKNDPRNVNGITLKSTAGVSFQNFGANGSRNWRIRPDYQSRWGDLDFSVSPTANSATDWPDAASDKVLTLGYDGTVTKPRQPYFKANLSSGVRITGTGYVVFSSAVHNNGSHYNTSDGKFTAPVTGLYWFSSRINAYDRIDFQIRVNGNEVERGQYNTDNDQVGWWSNQLTTITYMTAGQYAQVYVTNLDQNTDPDLWCSFMGYLVC